MHRLTASRWRHLIFLAPLGAGIGLLFGLAFDDVVFGVEVGTLLGVAFGVLFAARNPR